jgi:hypothetical protein
MRRWWPVAAVFAMLALAGVASATVQLPLSHVDSNPVRDQAVPTLVPSQAPSPRPTLTSEAPSEFRSLALPDWVLWALIAIAVALVATVLVVALGAAVRKGSKFKRRAIRRPQPRHAAPADVGSEVVAAVEAGLVELDEADVDPRRAVIACWVRLERAAAAAGTPRHPGDTSTDLVLRLLSGHHLSPDVLTGLAELYRQARYSMRRQVDAGMRDQARYALRQLRGELTSVSEVAT